MSSIIDRVYQAGQVLMGRNEPVRRGGGRGSNTITLKINTGAFEDEDDGGNSSSAKWRMKNSSSYINEGFEQNAIIFSAIMFKVRSIQTAQMRAYTGEKAKPELLPDSDPMARLIEEPNPYMTWQDIDAINVVFHNLLGDAMTLAIRDRPGAMPTALYPLNPDDVTLLFDQKKANKKEPFSFKGYYFAPGGKKEDGFPILPEDLIHFSSPNPKNPFGFGKGVSKLMAAARSGDVDNAVTDFIKRVFDQGGMPMGSLTYKIPLDTDQVAIIKERWREKYGGYMNWSDVLVLDQEGSYNRLSMTFEEMGFEVIDERNETRILGPLGVPPILTGTRTGLKHATYANYDAAWKAFWESTMLPEMRTYEAAYNRRLKMDRVFLKYDTSQVPPLRTDVNKQIDGAHKLWTMGVPANDALSTVGLSIQALPVGGVPYVPRMVVSVSEENPNPGAQPLPGLPQLGAPDPTQQPPDGKPKVEIIEGEEAADPKVKPLPGGKAKKSFEHMATKTDDNAREWEGDFDKGAKDCFEHDMREILAIVGEAEKAARRNKQNVFWFDVERDILEYLKEEGAGAENWRETFSPLIEGLMGDVGEMWATELGVTFDVRNIRGEAWFQDYVLKFATPINQTSSDAIKDIIAQGLAEGWSIPTMQEHMEQLFTQYMSGTLTAEDFAWYNSRMPPYRTEMIARTETIRASGAGAQNLFKEWGVQKRRWMSTNDDRTRPSHVAAQGQIRDIDEPFDIGGYKMMHPGDASLGAPPSEFIDCRCTLVAEDWEND